MNVQVSLTVQGGSAPNPVAAPPVTVNLFGPGDVVGVDPRYVIRTEPRPFTVNFEPNYLCGIDFDTPDFPWLFTPAAPNGDRLHPWVALIVLKASEFTAVTSPPNPLPSINVANIAALQDLSVSWNWAHVQISGNSSLADTLASAPGNVISRLVCPRRLEPETAYTAFLVPAFQIGVQAGLNAGNVGGLTTSDPAWTANSQSPLLLPYYYSFEFNTSDAGDFESLVRTDTHRAAAKRGHSAHGREPARPGHSVGRRTARFGGGARKCRHDTDALDWSFEGRVSVGARDMDQPNEPGDGRPHESEPAGSHDCAADLRALAGGGIER